MLLLYVIFSVFLVSFLFYKYMCRNFHYWQKKRVFYFEPSPFVGNFLDIVLLRKSIGHYFADLYNQTKEPLCGIFAFDEPHLMIRSPDLIKLVLVRDFNYFDNRSVGQGTDPVFAHTLFVSNNPEWKLMRNKISPAFTSGKLKSMVPLMSRVAGNLKKFTEKHASSTIEAKELCTKYSTDVLALCAFGINAHCFDNENADFRKAGRQLLDFEVLKSLRQACYQFKPEVAQFLRLTFAPPSVTNFLKDIFWKTMEIRAQNESTKMNDIIDAIMQMHKDEDFKKTVNLDGDRIVAQASQFFFAGFETTSSTMAYTLYELCLQPRIQERLREEILTSLKTKDGFTYENIMDMKYLNMCVSETLRKYPTLPFLDRRCNADYKVPGMDLVIEKNVAVFIPMFGLHYDEEYFPNPNQYDPERFNEENVKNIQPFTYIPFGEGPRNCIGARFGLLATKLGLVHILSEYEVVKTHETPRILEFEPKSFVLASKCGLPMKFLKITSKAG